MFRNASSASHAQSAPEPHDELASQILPSDVESQRPVEGSFGEHADGTRIAATTQRPSREDAASISTPETSSDPPLAENTGQPAEDSGGADLGTNRVISPPATVQLREGASESPTRAQNLQASSDKDPATALAGEGLAEQPQSQSSKAEDSVAMPGPLTPRSPFAMTDTGHLTGDGGDEDAASLKGAAAAVAIARRKSMGEVGQADASGVLP